MACALRDVCVANSRLISDTDGFQPLVPSQTTIPNDWSGESAARICLERHLPSQKPESSPTDKLSNNGQPQSRCRRLFHKSAPGDRLEAKSIETETEQPRKKPAVFAHFDLFVVNKRAERVAPQCVAPRHGFEPRFTAPKAAVLPLDDRGILGQIIFSVSG